MWNKIVNPKTGRKVDINGKIGKSVLKNYINQLGANELDNIKQNYKNIQLGGKSHYGPASLEKYRTIDHLAHHWWYKLEKVVWWSDGQDGYYFTNLKHKYMSKTHLHIFKVTGNRYYYSMKVNNIKYGTGNFVAKNTHEASEIITGICSYLYSESKQK